MVSSVVLFSLVALAHGSYGGSENYGLPAGKNTVKISFMIPSRMLNSTQTVLLTPEIKGTTFSDVPDFVTLIEHQDGKGKKTKILYDLGVRSDWENLPPAAVKALKDGNTPVVVQEDPPTQLRKNGIQPGDINTIILSHSHFDHTGDLNLFPKKTTNVIVGPGFKAAHLPGYPANPDSFLDQSGFDGRDVTEFPVGRKTITIASLQAIDYFGDGSFFIISAPGHDAGHIATLARVTKGRTPQDDTFILLAGDSGHHCGEYRPTKAIPLPKNIPRRQHLLEIHPKHSPYKPFYDPSSGGFNLNATQMLETLVGIEKMDASPNVFTLISHDHWLVDVVDFFPKSANDWKKKGWKESSLFRFVQDFA